jgi:hypothetical protein
MRRTVADVLISFEACEPVGVDDGPAATALDCEDDSESREELREFAIATAREEGFSEGTAVSAAAHAAALEAERGASAAHLAAERALWAHEEGRRLADGLAQGLAEIEARISTRTARILSGFLADRLIDRATRELARTIRELLAGADGKVVAVTGPADIVAALRETLAGDAVAVDFRSDTAADVRVVCDETLVESRLSAWVARLASVVE